MEYRLARCCTPQEDDQIVGFLKQGENVFSVHRADCPNLRKVSTDRLVTLEWDEINRGADEARCAPDSVLYQLDDVDRAILRHHLELGPDYAAVVAQSNQVPVANVFASQCKLRDLGLLRRVEPRMIQYRKGIVDGKWIKHRNHTYYEITAAGRAALEKSSPPCRK